MYVTQYTSTRQQSKKNSQKVYSINLMSRFNTQHPHRQHATSVSENQPLPKRRPKHKVYWTRSHNVSSCQCTYSIAFSCTDGIGARGCVCAHAVCDSRLLLATAVLPTNLRCEIRMHPLLNDIAKKGLESA